jgi:RNA polymerase subunit RPABC4/transcription elongation factor Spt4
VAACKHCKSLHITIDEVENNHCMRCGSTNEIKIYKDIHTYLTAKELEDDAE